MNDDAFPLAQVIFHLVHLLALAGQRARRGTQTVRRQMQEQKPVCLMPPGFRLRTGREHTIPNAKGTTMKPIIRYRSQLLFRKGYKPNPIIRIRPSRKAAPVVRAARAGPQINTYEYATD
jgi:hypothetical protein